VNNTVLLTGKGMIVNSIFSVLVRHYPENDCTWTQPKLKWWQTETRHELRIQNLPAVEVEALRAKVSVEGSVPIEMQVF
jgi:hypothetical protein